MMSIEVNTSDIPTIQLQGCEWIGKIVETADNYVCQIILEMPGVGLVKWTCCLVGLSQRESSSFSNHSSIDIDLPIIIPMTPVRVYCNEVDKSGRLWVSIKTLDDDTCINTTVMSDPKKKSSFHPTGPIGFNLENHSC